MDSKAEIKDISLFDDSNFIRYRCPDDYLLIPSWMFKKKKEYTYFMQIQKQMSFHIKFIKHFVFHINKEGKRKLIVLLGKIVQNNF